ncbi:toprim domain-containing protein [Caldiplasma sukawensis]
MIQSNDKIPIIVEGDHDVETLKKIGLQNPLFKINTGIPLGNLSILISEKFKTVILLTDFDRKGKQIHDKMKIFLEGDGCNVDDILWRYIFRNYKIKSVEDLPFLISQEIEKYGLKQ